MKTNVKIMTPPSSLMVGLVEAFDIKVGEASESYKETINSFVRPMLSPDFIYPDKMQKGVRSLLRGFGFHPSGRSRPASEFLFKDLQNRGCFNFINNIVDINNHISLKTNLPISVFDLEKSGSDLCLRVGEDDETYVFNQEGQVLTLKKLLIVAKTQGEPIGSPVKDSQATKIFEDAKSLLFVVYASSTLTSTEEMQQILDEIAQLLKDQAGAQTTETQILSA